MHRPSPPDPKAAGLEGLFRSTPAVRSIRPQAAPTAGTDSPELTAAMRLLSHPITCNYDLARFLIAQKNSTPSGLRMSSVVVSSAFTDFKLQGCRPYAD